MKNKWVVFIGLLMLIVFGLSACQSAIVEPTIDLQALVSTSVAQTLAANVQIPTATSQVLPTIPPLPSATPLPTINTVPTYQPPVPTKTPCYHMAFVKDVTISDGTKMAPGTGFTKTWRVYNDGSCTWTTAFSLTFSSGDQLGAPASVPLTANVLSGSTVDISVNMVAPSTVGSYTSGWKMKAADGTIFGSGSGVPITAVISVESVTFAVTKVVITVDHASPTAATCGTAVRVNFNAAITVNAPGTVNLTWHRSDGGTGPSDTLTFTGPGTKNSTNYWDLTANTTGSYSIRIDSPNNQSFGPGGNFTYTCTP